MGGAGERATVRDRGSHRAQDVSLRVLLLVYAVYATVEAVRLGWVVSYPFTPVAQVALPLAVLIAGGLALRPVVGARRRVAVRFGPTVIAVQFLLTFGTFTPWIGLLLGVAMVVVLRPNFSLLSRPNRRHMLFVHVTASVSWLGLAMAMLVLSVVGLVADEELARSSYEIMHIFDLALVIPLVVISIVTGILLSLLTKWGLVRHWWVLAKFVMSMTILGTAAFYEAFLVQQLADDITGRRDEQIQLFVCMVGFTALLVAATVLSIYQPRGRTPWAPSTGRSAGGEHPVTARAID